jgi:hypothetical protein
MVCPLCNKHKLLQAEEKWFCPYCFNVYHHLPLYGLSNRIKYSLYGHGRYSKLFSQPHIDSQGCGDLIESALEVF